jgi:hypothetical protein
MDSITGLISLIGNGGWVAIGVFLGYFIKRLDRRIERLEGKIETMREEFITREEHYRDISGWRGEVNRIDSKIDRLSELIIRYVPGGKE